MLTHAYFEIVFTLISFIWDNHVFSFIVINSLFIEFYPMIYHL